MFKNDHQIDEKEKNITFPRKMRFHQVLVNLWTKCLAPFFGSMQTLIDDLKKGFIKQVQAYFTQVPIVRSIYHRSKLHHLSNEVCLVQCHFV